METIAPSEVVWLICVAVLLLLVVIILLRRRSSIYKKYSEVCAKLATAEAQIIKLKNKKPAHLDQKPLENQKTKNTPQISPSMLYEKSIKNLEYSLKQIQTLFNEGAANNITITPILKRAIININLMRRTTENLSMALNLPSEKIKFTPVNLRHELTRMYTKNSSRVSANDLSLDIDISGKINTIKTNLPLLQKLLNEFMDNALLYTKSGKITIKASEDKDRTRISIIDTGIGIRLSEQREIFDLHYRSQDSRATDKPGSGVGLYLCSIIANKLGGNISVKSRLNHGSEFTLELKTDR